MGKFVGTDEGVLVSVGGVEVLLGAGVFVTVGLPAVGAGVGVFVGPPADGGTGVWVAVKF